MDKLCELSKVDGVRIQLPTYFIYKKSMKDNLNDCEIPIRFLALDNYFGKNDFGFAIYDEIQKYRVGNNSDIPIEQYDNMEKFKLLIESMSTNGFLSEYPLVLNKHFAVVDGAHRLAIALYLGIQSVPVIFPQEAFDFEFDYSLDWLRNNGFDRYADLILEQHQKIIQRYDSGEKNV